MHRPWSSSPHLMPSLTPTPKLVYSVLSIQLLFPLEHSLLQEALVLRLAPSSPSVPSGMVSDTRASFELLLSLLQAWDPCGAGGPCGLEQPSCGVSQIKSRICVWEASLGQHPQDLSPLQTTSQHWDFKCAPAHQTYSYTVLGAKLRSSGSSGPCSCLPGLYFSSLREI